MPALVELHVRYRLQTAYAIHGDSEHSSHVDRPVERGPDGWPLIPASSWRGRVRAQLESLLRALNVPVCYPPAPANTCPHDAAVLRRLRPYGRWFCPVCDLFGSAWHPSRVQFDDLVHLHRPRGTIAVAERVSVSINRSTGSAEEQHLTSFEAAGGDEALHTLTGRVRGYLEPVQVGLLVTALRLPTHFGAEKARGLGLIGTLEIETTQRTHPWSSPAVVDEKTVESWVEQALEEVTRLAAPAAV